MGEVNLVPHYDCLDFGVTVTSYLHQPFAQTFEGGDVGYVKHQEGRDGALVVGASDRFEGLLTCLTQNRSTVSQTCILMV